jgi:hypothetical protein
VSDQSDALNKSARKSGVIFDRASYGAVSDQSDALNALARARGIIPETPAELRLVELPRNGRLMLHFSSEVGAIVGANGLFRREAVPVTIDPETGRIEAMSPERLRSYVETGLVGYVERHTSFGSRKMQATMSTTEARGCLACDAFRQPLRKLRRVHQVRLPVERRDGRIELLPRGYDAESGFFTMKDCFDYDGNWTLERAQLFLADLLAEFPFADARSRAVHVTAMVALFASAILPVGAKAMSYLWRANQARSGKGLLASMAISGPFGTPHVQSIPDDTEFRKLLDTEALNGSAYIFLDEVERKLANRALNAFLTSSLWTGRLMFSQQKFIVEQSAIVLLTGNGTELSADLAGRVLLVDLFVTEADAQAREIRRVIDDRYLARQDVRADLLAALWALVRFWDKSGRPGPATVFRGFETFSAIFGGIVQHAGFSNPLTSTVAEVDPDFDDMLAVIERLAESAKTRRAEFEFSELIEACRNTSSFEWQLEGRWVREASGADRFEPSPRALTFFGKLFMKYGGTKFSLSGGRRVQFGRRGKNRQRRFTLEFEQAR